MIVSGEECKLFFSSSSFQRFLQVDGSPGPPQQHGDGEGDGSENGDDGVVEIGVSVGQEIKEGPSHNWTWEGKGGLVTGSINMASGSSVALLAWYDYGF